MAPPQKVSVTTRCPANERRDRMSESRRVGCETDIVFATTAREVPALRAWIHHAALASCSEARARKMSLMSPLTGALMKLGTLIAMHIFEIF